MLSTRSAQMIKLESERSSGDEVHHENEEERMCFELEQLVFVTKKVAELAVDKTSGEDYQVEDSMRLELLSEGKPPPSEENIPCKDAMSTKGTVSRRVWLDRRLYIPKCHNCTRAAVSTPNEAKFLHHNFCCGSCQLHWMHEHGYEIPPEMIPK